MAGEHGFEPWNGGFKGPCLTAWLLPKRTEADSTDIFVFPKLQNQAK